MFQTNPSKQLPYIETFFFSKSMGSTFLQCQLLRTFGLKNKKTSSEKGHRKHQMRSCQATYDMNLCTFKVSTSINIPDPVFGGSGVGLETERQQRVSPKNIIERREIYGNEYI